MTVRLFKLGAIRPTAWLRVFATSAALLWSASIERVMADRISDETEDISITDATADPAKRAAYTNVHVQIENIGPKTVTLKSVDTEVGERASFDVHIGRGSIHSKSLSLGSGEQMSFNDNRFQLTIGPLKRDLNEGDVIEITFTFDDFATSVPVHVHRDQEH